MSKSSSRLLPLVIGSVAATAMLLPSASMAKTFKAPSGNAFYTASAGQIAGAPGTMIWSRTIKTKAVALSQASKTLLVLYRSTALNGDPIAVSGTIDVPKGKAPKGGWKMISWAHGTTGMADVCAPSRNSSNSPAKDYISYTDATYNAWLKKGYAILRTDYEGLGTPGHHPYLIGHSEGRGVIDIARAAYGTKSLHMAKKWLIAGHSQGGQSSLFAAADATARAPQLELKGVVAFAPASHIYQQKSLLGVLKNPSPLTGLATMIVASAAREAGLNAADYLSAQVAAFLPQLEIVCSAQLAQTSKLGGIAPNTMLKPGVDTSPVDPTLRAMNPDLAIAVPVFILQGLADTTVQNLFTKKLPPLLRAHGDKVDFKTYAGLSHSGIVMDKKSSGDATAWIKKQFAK